MRQRGRWVWGLWLLASLWSLGFVARAGRNLPFSDEWLDFSHVVGEEPLSLSWLWHPLNEQRLPLPRLLYVGIVRATGDVRAVMAINAGGLAAAAALLLVAARRLRGRTAARDAVFPLLLLGPAHYENLLCALQISFVAAAVLGGAAVLAMVAAPGLPSDRRIVAVGALAALLPLVGGTGLLLAAGPLGWLVGVLVIGGARRASLAALAVGAAPALAYAACFEHPPRTPPYRLDALPRAWLEVAGTAFGVNGVAPHILGAAALLLAGAGLVALGRSPGDRWQRAGILAGTGSALALGWGIAYGRGMYGLNAAVVPRYTSVAAFTLACAALSFACMERARWARAAGALLLAGLVGLLPLNARAAHGFASAHAAQVDALAGEIAAGLPVWRLAAHHGLAVYDDDGREVPGLLRLMQRHHFGYYRQAPTPGPDPAAWEERPLDLGEPLQSHDLAWHDGEAVAVGPDPYVVYAVPVQDVPALRLEVLLEQPQPSHEAVEFHLWWALDAAHEGFRPEARNVGYFLPSAGPATRHLTFYIDARIDRLRLDPDLEHARFRLIRAAVLVPSGPR
jgi:hypothetical protein